MTAPRGRVDRDPDRVPGAPPGYIPVFPHSAQLGTCDRCGATVNTRDPAAKEFHEKFHQGLRAMWAAAQSKAGGSA